MAYRIPRNDMCMSDAMPFSQHWEVRTTVSLSLLKDLGDALQQGLSSFRAGDLVHVCVFADKQWKRLCEVASARIVSIDDDRVDAVLVSPIQRIDVPHSAKQGEIDTTLKLVKVRNAYEVRDHLENVIEIFVEESQARAFIDGVVGGRRKAEPSPIVDDTPPQELEASKKGVASGLTVHKVGPNRWGVKTRQNRLVKEFDSEAAAIEYVDSANKVAA